MKHRLLAAALAAGAFLNANAQQVYVKDTVMTTYGFSCPDAVPNTSSKIFPYWRFRQFDKTSTMQSWTMVVLENPYLRVKIFPQIGGKVWSIYDKTSGKEMFYDNNAVKFRDISLRGPWTSGGIEFNYGVIGHAPSCSHPVDWKTEVKEDGSVSCYIGVGELLSRSRWTIEINLPKDAVWVRTSSFWHNESDEYQPYYNWANSGVITSDDLQLIFPANNAIGHDGKKLSYPVNEDGKDFSLLKNQAYGADKSYHMVGSHKSFFGVYYPSEDRGVLHYSLRDEKVGRKYFTWAQSEQGTIWVDLLTDCGTQYVEMQSGRLFNQNMTNSSENSSYRQFLFTPYGTDRWSDYWLPFSGIGAADEVNLHAVTSVNGCNIGIYPLRELKGELTICSADGKELYKEKVNHKPAETFTIVTKEDPACIAINGLSIWTSDDQRISRPQERNAAFDPESAEAKVLLGRDYFGMKLYDEAEKLTDEALASDEDNLAALCLKTELLLHRLRFNEALEYSDKALAIDQYNPEAGYFGGLAALELGRQTDALDRFEIAAIANSDIRQACYTELAKMHFCRTDMELAASYAQKALDYNSGNVTAQYILRKCGNNVSISDPLSHFPAAEKFLKGEINAKKFAEDFQEELAWEDYLELAIFHNSLGLDKDALAILGALPEQNALTSLWMAYIKGDTKSIAKAERENIDFVFPFRKESWKVLEWAVGNGGKWQSKYLFAILKGSFGYKAEALALMDDEDTGYAPYYGYRYSITGKTEDARKAFDLQKDDWTYRWLLAGKLLQDGQSAEAVALLENCYKENPDLMHIGDVLMDAYIAENRFEDAEKIVDTIEYLPFEGMRGSHDKYRHIKLHLAVNAIDNGDLDKGEKLVKEALEWPVRLGAGKPYDDMIDTSTEDWLLKEISQRRNASGPFEPVSAKLGNLTSKDKKLF